MMKIDYDEIRLRAALAAMQSLLHEQSDAVTWSDFFENVADKSMQMADAFVERLKKDYSRTNINEEKGL